MSSELAVVIVNYNTADLTLACVRSVLAEQMPYSFATSIVVVDNGSTGEERACLRDALPAQVQFIQLDMNHGFSLANNVGVRAVLHHNPTWLVFVNSDTTVCSGAMARAIELMSDSSIGAVGMRLLHADKPTIVQYGPGRFNPFTGHVRFGDVGIPRLQALATPIEVNMVHGGAMVVRTSAFLAVGMFPDDLFMYGEDVELALRLSQSGWKLYYHPGAEVLHSGGASSGGYMSPFALYHSTLSQWRIIRRNFPLIVYLLYAAYSYLWFLPAFTAYCLLFRRHLVRPFLSAYRDHLYGRLNTPPPLPKSLL